jgi:hypothetical protein
VNRRFAAAAALLAVLALAAAGCTTDKQSSRPKSPAEPSSAPAAPAAPKVGSCHNLSFAQATAVVDSRKPVRCGDPHTSITYRTGQIDLTQDGHLLAVDSQAARARFAKACAPRLGRYLGGSTSAVRLSRFEAVWFGPSVEQADAGATWYRCDVVLVRSEGKLLRLPRSVKGVLADASGLDRYGTCGTASPDSKSFHKVVCSQRHSWRAIDDLDIDPKARYLGKGASAAGDSACKSRAEARAKGALRYSWSFAWPTRQQWDDGVRYGLCWVPDRG